MTPEQEGICRSCGAAGPVGGPCGDRVCSRWGYHFLPAEYVPRTPAAELDPMVGRAIDDYIVARVLGSGGFGKVFLALQQPILLRTALKLLHKEARPDLAEVKHRKFVGEAQALARLTHPNIVRLLKYGVFDGAPYMAMEFVEGGRTLKEDLAARVRRGEAMGARAIWNILPQLLDGLESAHERSIVHRDIKPENIMLQAVAGNPDFVRILDFGLAKFVGEAKDTTIVMGTVAYMAPEQLLRRDIGPWTDLFAVGCVAFEMMTGRRAYVAGTDPEIMAIKLDPDYDPVSRLGDLEVPEAAARFFRRALAVDPQRRFRSAAAFREALEATFAAIEAARTPSLMSVDLSGLVSPSELRRARPEAPAVERAMGRGPHAAGGGASPPAPEDGSAPLRGPSRRERQVAPSAPPSERVSAPGARAKRGVWLAAAGVAVTGVVVVALALGPSASPAGDRGASEVPPAPAPIVQGVAAAAGAGEPELAVAEAPPPVTAPPPGVQDAVAALNGALDAARAAIAGERWDEAEEHIQVVMVLDRDNPAGRRLRGQVEGERAVSEAYQAIQAAQTRGDLRAAWEAVQELDELPADSRYATRVGELRAVVRSGLIYRLLDEAREAHAGQRFDAAIRLADEALVLEAGHAEAEAVKAAALRNRAATRVPPPSAAREPTKPAETTAPSASTKTGKELYQDARAIHRSDPQGALKLYTESANKGFSTAFRQIGLLQTSLGNTDRAITAYKRYLALNPDARDAGVVRDIVIRLGGTF